MTENPSPGPGAAYAPGAPPPSAPPPPYPGAARPALRRSRDDRVVAGVCGGLGRTLGVDPLLIRVLLVVLTVVGGSGLLAYLIGWLLIPEDGATTSEGQRLYDETKADPSGLRSVLTIVAAVLLALLAVPLLLATVFGGWGHLDGVVPGLLLLVAALVGLAVWGSRSSRPPAPPSPAPGWAPAPGPVAGPFAGTAAGMAEAPETAAPGAPPVASDTAVLIAPVGYAYGGTGGYGPYGTAPASVPPPPVRRERSALGAMTLSLAVLVVGLLAGADVLGADIPPVAYLAAPLAVLGLGLLVGAMVGRARWLLAIAIPLALLTALVAAVPQTVRETAGSGVGERRWTPTTVAAATTEYRLAAGDARLDLTAVPTTSTGQAVPVRVRLGTGRLIVVVPRDALVRVDASVGMGELRVSGEPARNGAQIELTTVLTPVGTSSGTFDLVLDVGVGSLEVRREAS